MHHLNLLYSPLKNIKDLDLTKNQQWALTAGAVTLAGAPFTPICNGFEEIVIDLLPTHPLAAGSLMLGQFGMSLLMMRFVFTKVLNSKRFHTTGATLKQQSAGDGSKKLTSK